MELAYGVITTVIRMRIYEKSESFVRPNPKFGAKLAFLARTTGFLPSLSLTLNVEPPGPDLTLRCSTIKIHIWEPDTDRNMIL